MRAVLFLIIFLQRVASLPPGYTSADYSPRVLPVPPADRSASSHWFSQPWSKDGIHVRLEHCIVLSVIVTRPAYPAQSISR